MRFSVYPVPDRPRDAALLAPAQQAAANVFAHNIRVTQPTSTDPFDAKFNDGTGAAIRFVLSDHADSVLVMINSGAITIRTLRGINFPSGDTLRRVGRQQFRWHPVSPPATIRSWSRRSTRGTTPTPRSSTTQPSIFTRGVTAIRNTALKNFGFIYAADNGGYATGIARHSADGRLWGNSKGVAKLNNTGAVVGPANLRYSSEADEEGYVYLIGRDNKQIFRYHTDTMFVCPGRFRRVHHQPRRTCSSSDRTGSGRVMAVAGNSKVYFMPHRQCQHGWFQPKTIAIDGDSTVVFWDVQFGERLGHLRDVLRREGQHRPGVAKFHFGGWDGSTPKKLADAQWTVTVDSGRGNTMALAHGKDSTGADDMLYFTIARRKTSDANVKPEHLCHQEPLQRHRPSLDTVYKDKQNNMTAGTVRHRRRCGRQRHLLRELERRDGPDLAADRAEQLHDTDTQTKIKVIISETIAAVRRQTVDPYKPDRVGDTVTVIGTVISMNPTASANRFQYFIQDATGGINVTKGSVTGGGPVYKFGDRLVVKGVVGLNRGTTQLNIVNMTDVQLLDSNNAVTPKVLTIQQFLADAEKYESQLIKFVGVSQDRNVAWHGRPLGADANMTITDGYRELLLRIDLDMELDGTTEPVYPMSVQGVATQFTSAANCVQRRLPDHPELGHRYHGRDQCSAEPVLLAAEPGSHVARGPERHGTDGDLPLACSGRSERRQSDLSVAPGRWLCRPDQPMQQRIRSLSGPASSS